MHLRPTRRHPILGRFQLRQDFHLPTTWRQLITTTLRRCEYETVFDGNSITSLHNKLASPLTIRVVDGEIVKRDLPWLFSAYAHSFLKLLNGLGFGCFKIDNGILGSITVNHLEGRGAAYEKHVDTNDITGVLFVNSLKKSDGGQFELASSYGKTVKIRPVQGELIFFDGKTFPHSVRPLLTNEGRVTVAMNYLRASTIYHRPSDLDEYLYGKRAKR